MTPGTLRCPASGEARGKEDERGHRGYSEVVLVPSSKL